MDSSLEGHRCRVCGSGAEPRVLSVSPARYLDCPVCGSMVLDPFPLVEVNSAFEGPAEVARSETKDLARRPYFRRRLKLIEGALGHRGSLLEVGCGAGVLLEEARQLGWQVAGVELSKDLAEKSRQRNPGARIWSGDFLTSELPINSWDAVIGLDVLEHVVSPEAMIEKCRDVLTPRGALLIQTPNTRSLRARLEKADWDMLAPDQHLVLFSGSSLDNLLVESDWDVLVSRTVSGSGSERGLSAWIGKAKEEALNVLGWGNGLLVMAQKPE